MTADPFADIRAQCDLYERVRAEVLYSYEAGEYRDLDPDVATFVDGDGGLINALDGALRMLAALDAVQKIVNERIVCPEHNFPDCSPLLNGCSRPILLGNYRERIAAALDGAT